MACDYILASEMSYASFFAKFFYDQCTIEIESKQAREVHIYIKSKQNNIDIDKYIIVQNSFNMYMNMTPLARLGYNMSCIWMRNKRAYRYVANVISFSMQRGGIGKRYYSRIMPGSKYQK